MKLLERWNRFFYTVPSRPLKTGSRFRPRLDALEGRFTPSGVINYWDGPAGGLWSVASNWSNGHIPTSGEEAWIAPPLYGTNTSSTDNIPSLTVAHFYMSAGFTATVTIEPNCSINSATDIAQAGTVVLDPGASLNAAKNFFLAGTVIVEGQGYATAALTSGGSVFALTGSVTTTLPNYNGVINLNIEGALNQSGKITLANNTTATMTIPGAYVITPVGSDTLGQSTSLTCSIGGILDNKGTITMEDATLTTTGTLKLDQGTLNTDGNMVGGSAPDTINGNVDNEGNIVFGGASVHTLHISGTYLQAFLHNAGLSMRINNLGEDNLFVTGMVTLDGGSLTVTGTPAVPPFRSWYILTSPTGITGSFSSESFPPPPPGSVWDTEVIFDGINFDFDLW
jgi:hypothetical protein